MPEVTQTRSERIESVMNLSRSLARKYAARGLPPGLTVEDLESEGYIGACRAADGFEEGHGASFETYAFIKIKGAIVDALEKTQTQKRKSTAR